MKSAATSVSGKEQLLCVLCENNMFGVLRWEKGELCCYCCPGTLSGVLEAEGENPDFICMFLEARFNKSTVGG